MAFRKLLTNFMIPNMERDLTRSVTTEMASVTSMVDNMLAPQVYSYATIGSSTLSNGAFQGSGSLRQQQASNSNKIVYKVQTEGLFEDQQLSFHSMKK